MDARLPAKSRTPLAVEVSAVVDAVAQSTGTGYIEARFDDGTARYLLHKGDKVWCAGKLGVHGERVQPEAWPVGRFFVELEAAEEVWRCEIELPLFLCVGVLFRKAPAAQIPTQLVDSEAILRGLEAAGKDAVLAVECDGAMSMAFCREGSPTALFAADLEPFPDEGAVTDRIVEYILLSKEPVQLFVFDEIKLPPAADGGPIREVANVKLQRERAAILVRLGERVAFRYPILGEMVVVGRGEDVDLVLDNLSVSRRHLILHVGAEGIVAEDLGSENGTQFGDKRITKAALRPGDVLVVGKYSLEIVEPSNEMHRSKAPRDSRPPGISAEDTVAITSTVVPTLMRGEEELRVKGMVFSIGRGEAANLKLGGLFIADVHAVLRRSTDGRWSVRHVAGMRAVKVNGTKVKEVALFDGDEIAIAGEVLRFYLPESPRSSASSSRAS